MKKTISWDDFLSFQGQILQIAVAKVEPDAFTSEGQTISIPLYICQTKCSN